MINPLRLANEWRDTLLLTTSIAAFAAFGSKAAFLAAMIGFCREVLRDMKWSFRPPLQVIGAHRPLPVDVQVGAAYTHVTLSASVFFFDPVPTGLTLAGGTLVYLTCYALHTLRMLRFSRTLRQAAAGYLGAWDWPRKRGGPTETEKLSKFVADVGLYLRPQMQASATLRKSPLS